MQNRSTPFQLLDLIESSFPPEGTIRKCFSRLRPASWQRWSSGLVARSRGVGSCSCSTSSGFLTLWPPLRSVGLVRFNSFADGVVLHTRQLVIFDQQPAPGTELEYTHLQASAAAHTQPPATEDEAKNRAQQARTRPRPASAAGRVQRPHSARLEAALRHSKTTPGLAAKHSLHGLQQPSMPVGELEPRVSAWVDQITRRLMLWYSPS